VNIKLNTETKPGGAEQLYTTRHMQ